MGWSGGFPQAASRTWGKRQGKDRDHDDPTRKAKMNNRRAVILRHLNGEFAGL